MPLLATAAGLSHDEVQLLYPAISVLMSRSVRLGSAPCSGLSWLWGYGWTDCDHRVALCRAKERPWSHVLFP